MRPAYVLLAIVVGGCAEDVSGLQPPTVPLSAAVQAHVRGERFQVVTSLRGLPLGVRDALQRLFGGQSLEISEPGEAFRSTVEADVSLPIRRLVLAACAQDHCLVYYERGGGPRSWRAALYHWTPTETRLEAGGVARGGITSITALRDAVLAGLPESTFW